MQRTDDADPPAAAGENPPELQAEDPAEARSILDEIWADIEEIRKHVDRSKFFTVKDLIEEGRR